MDHRLGSVPLIKSWARWYGGMRFHRYTLVRRFGMRSNLHPARIALLSSLERVSASFSGNTKYQHLQVASTLVKIERQQPRF